MSTYTETSEKLQAQVLEGIKRLQEANLEMAANFSKATGNLLPNAPTVPAAIDPKQYIERTFGFTTEILDLQKDYLLRMTETLKPVATSNGSTKAAKPV
jgi:hypothetical protein